MKNMKGSFRENIANKASTVIGNKVINTIGSGSKDCFFFLIDEIEMPEELMQYNLSMKTSEKK